MKLPARWHLTEPTPFDKEKKNVKRDRMGA
jgi:hypothetical protein